MHIRFAQNAQNILNYAQNCCMHENDHNVCIPICSTNGKSWSPVVLCAELQNVADLNILANLSKILEDFIVCWFYRGFEVHLCVFLVRKSSRLFWLFVRHICDICQQNSCNHVPLLLLVLWLVGVLVLWNGFRGFRQFSGNSSSSK